MSICVIRYFLKTVKDKDTKDILKYSLNLAESHVSQIKTYYKQENYPIPVGFTKDDVNYDAPPLFSDTFVLVYMHIMTLHGLTGYAGAVGTSTREDQVDYFIQCNTDTMKLYKMIIKVMLDKGIITKPPTFHPDEKVDFVKEQRFLNGWFGGKRPLSAIELSGLYYNLQKNIVKIVLEIGFSQVVQSKQIRKYIQRGEKICDKQFNLLASILSESNLPYPQKWDSEVTKSTQSPFSDKLLLFHIVTLISAASGYYGAALAVSQRRDLALKYEKLIIDIMKYAEDGINIMIEQGWFEQPPLAADRNALAEKGAEE